MSLSDIDSFPCQNIGGKLIPTKFVDSIKMGDYIIIYSNGCWNINSRNQQIISFISQEEMDNWERSLIPWRNSFKNKQLSNPYVKHKKGKRRSKRPKVLVRKEFVCTYAFRRMRNDSDYWREQT